MDNADGSVQYDRLVWYCPLCKWVYPRKVLTYADDGHCTECGGDLVGRRLVHDPEKASLTIEEE